MRKPKAKSKANGKSIKPLYLYLGAGVVAMLSGWLIRPVNDSIHSAVVIACLGVCIYAVYKYIKS